MVSTDFLQKYENKKWFTKKHWTLIALLLKDVSADDQVVNDFAIAFKNDSWEFDEKYFFRTLNKKP